MDGKSQDRPQPDLSSASVFLQKNKTCGAAFLQRSNEGKHALAQMQDAVRHGLFHVHAHAKLTASRRADGYDLDTR